MKTRAKYNQYIHEMNTIGTIAFYEKYKNDMPVLSFPCEDRIDGEYYSPWTVAFELASRGQDFGDNIEAWKIGYDSEGKTTAAHIAASAGFVKVFPEELMELSDDCEHTVRDRIENCRYWEENLVEEGE